MKKSRYGNEISLWKNLAMNPKSRYEKISLCKNLAMKKSRYERTSPWKGLTMKWCYTLSTYALYLRDPSFSQIDVRYILSWHMLLQARPRKIMWDFCVKFVWNLVPETILQSRRTKILPCAWRACIAAGCDPRNSHPQFSHAATMQRHAEHLEMLVKNKCSAQVALIKNRRWPMISLNRTMGACTRTE